MGKDKNEMLSAEDFGLTDLDEGGDSGGGVSSQDDIDSLLGESSDSPAPSKPSRSLTMGSSTDHSNIKMILDVPMMVTVELGQTRMRVNDLLQLGQGSVIELDKMAGEPMEILVNDKVVALGEVVVINERFGVRLTDIVSNIGLEENDQVA